MAFKAFMTERHTDDTGLPWTEQYVSDNPDSIGLTLDVRTIRLTAKGMMIATDVCKAFIYKSHVTYDHVVEFLEAWSGKKTPSPLLQVQLTTSRPFIVLGVDDARNGIWSPKTEDSWRQAYATVSDNIAMSSNPLPLPPRPGVSVLSDTSAYMGEHGVIVGVPNQTSQEMPLAEAGSPLNGVKGTNSRKRK